MTPNEQDRRATDAAAGEVTDAATDEVTDAATDEAERVVERFVEEIVGQATDGEPAALDAVLPAVYHEMRLLAAYLLRGERAARTLQPTALAHEAYLRLARARFEAQNAKHLLYVGASVMRRVLVDAARKRRTAKRGNDAQKVTLSDSLIDDGGPPVELLDLHRALDKLAERHPRKVQVIEMRYFTGLTLEEIAEALELNERTVRRDWDFARAWLWNELNESETPS